MNTTQNEDNGAIFSLFDQLHSVLLDMDKKDTLDAYDLGFIDGIRLTLDIIKGDYENMKENK